MENQLPCDSGKKVALEELSKDELVKKCKGLLVIAQKAKQTKDALQEENNELKNKLKTENTSEGATKEIIESLTQQKLEHVNTIEDLKKQNNLLSNKLQTTLEELCLHEEKSNALDNENVSYKRQIKRLTDENEQLITHLDSLEKQLEECKRLGLEQQEQLLALENTNKRLQSENASNSQSKELQNMLSISLEEVKKLQCENNDLKEKVDNLKLNLSEKDNNIVTISEALEMKSILAENLRLELLDLHNNDKSKELIEELKISQEMNENLRSKLKLYHSKMVKFAGNIKILKENKNEILNLFKVYTDQVEEWKSQLSVTSKQLVQLITDMEQVNLNLEQENQILLEANAKYTEQLKAHKTDDEKSKEINDLETIKADNIKLTEEVDTLVQLQEEYKNQIEVLTIEKESISSELMNLIEKHQKEIEVFDDRNKKDTREIQERIDENEKICIEYRKVISKFEENIEVNVREIEELKAQNRSLQEELQHSKETETQLANRTSEEIMKLVQENAELTQITKKLQKQVVTTTDDCCQTDNNGETEEKVSSLKRENAELLTEMNEMNQALKERGESISKLQAHCEEIMKKLQIYETQANKNVDNITQKEEIIKKLQQELEDARTGDQSTEIAQLKTEIEGLREKLNANFESSYAESETMSTSTISRSEEANRLKDLEGSWEERYGKLRNFALKLKAKIRDLTTELSREQNEKNEVQQKYACGVKAIASLQTQCDKLEDDLERSRKESKEYLSRLDALAVEISQDKEKFAENDELIGTLKQEIDEYKQEKLSTENWKKQISAKVQTFRKELEANKVLKKEYEAKIAKLTADLEAKEQELKAESDCHKQTKNSLEHSNNERKKNSVLSLEMQDYERSVKDLSSKLEKKREEVNKLKNQLDSQKSTQNAIREQNKILEERVQTLENELAVSHSEIVAYKKQISECEEVVLQKENKIHSLTQQLETIRGENEELSTELSKVIAEHQKTNTTLKQEKEHLRSQLLGLQQSLRETQDTLKLKEDELKAIQKDYDNYKVRAQSVLRQNQNRDVGLEEKLNEEVSGLKTKCERLDLEMTRCLSQIETLKEENEKLEKEKVEVLEKFKAANGEIEGLRNLYDQLANKHQSMIVENGETVRSLKVHAETLAQCYRQQLSEQEVRHNREIIELQSKIEKAPSPVEVTLPPLPTMPREEGEGSESTESVNKGNTYPVPLERLLNGDTDQEVALIKKQLVEEESKVAHLTALLADTEQDLAKHAQMNKLLKEEIRRLQRSVEREKHAENLEYLKNVVFKFITLNSGDERSRLVPVLNTILKLSPEETQKLNAVARGEAGLKGWTNYLPLWSSPSKP